MAKATVPGWESERLSPYELCTWGSKSCTEQEGFFQTDQKERENHPRSNIRKHLKTKSQKMRGKFQDSKDELLGRKNHRVPAFSIWCHFLLSPPRHHRMTESVFNRGKYQTRFVCLAGPLSHMRASKYAFK
jgi:hypothetical protein